MCFKSLTQLCVRNITQIKCHGISILDCFKVACWTMVWQKEVNNMIFSVYFSLCTTLCLQWEPHIVATAFLYLAGRLSKSDLLDWSGKNTKAKWWDQLTDDVSLEIMEGRKSDSFA